MNSAASLLSFRLETGILQQVWHVVVVVYRGWFFRSFSWVGMELLTTRKQNCTGNQENRSCYSNMYHSFVVFLRTTPQRPTTPTAAVVRASLLSNLQVLPATPAVFHRRPGHHYEHVPATQLMDGKGVFWTRKFPTTPPPTEIVSLMRNCRIAFCLRHADEPWNHLRPFSNYRG